jgi:hypothetical protein
MAYDIESYLEHDEDKLFEIWEPRKKYIEKDLWIIRNFLSEEEIAWLNEQANDPKDWYTTMRSPYGGNVKNKFLGYIVEYDDNGNMLVPGLDAKNTGEWNRWPVENRLRAIVPKYFAGAGTFQSFFEVPDEQIIAELGHDVDYAMDFHYERDEEDGGWGGTPSTEAGITAAISLYVNDNFDGGILEFKNKPYVIKPEAGMLVNIPLYKEFEHRITKVKNGNRHSLYGRSWDKIENRYVSTNNDC